jgi:hypothetical protein
MDSQGHSKLYVREADYKLLQSQKADTTTFVVSKKRTLQTFLVDGLCIVVFCIQSISKLCSICPTFCSLL